MSYYDVIRAPKLRNPLTNIATHDVAWNYLAGISWEGASSTASTDFVFDSFRRIVILS